MTMILIALGFIFSSFAGECDLLTVACTIECRDTYKKALSEAGEELGHKVKVITLIEDPKASYDALLSPGGGDIHYRYYTDQKYNKELLDVSSLTEKIKKDYKEFSGERSEKGLKRDAFEVALWQKYFSDKSFEKVPAIGICYGMQMLGVANGLPMRVDIDHDLGVPARRKVLETIDIHKEKDVTKILSKPFTGYYNHHQALHYDFYKKNRSYYEKRFEIIASSNEGKIPEMLRFKKRPAFGVQFHPERLEGKHRKNAIQFFKWLLQKACLKRKSAI